MLSSSRLALSKRRPRYRHSGQALGGLGPRIEELEDRTLLSVELADPLAGHAINPAVLNSRAYIEVSFTGLGGSGVNLAEIIDPEAEFTLGGTAATGVVVDGAATLVAGTTYRYTFTGRFEPGTVTVDFVAESFSDEAGNLNAAETETFTVRIPQGTGVDGDDLEPTPPSVPADRITKEGFVYGYDPARHDRFFNFRTDPVPNPDFFLAHHDLSGIAWRLNYRNLPVLISPQHFIFGAHVGVNLNTAIRFMNRDGEVKSLATVELFPIPGSDLKLGKLNRPFTADDKVTHYPILSSVAEAYVGREILFFKQQMQAGKSWTTGLSFINQLPRGLKVNPHYLPDSSTDGVFAVRGDSGNPSFVEHEGKLALVGIHIDEGEEQLIAPFIQEINTILAEDGFELGVLADQEVVAGPASLFFGDEVLDGQPPFPLVGQTVSQKQQIVIHNFTTSEKELALATTNPFFQVGSAFVLVPAEASVSVAVRFASDTYGEHTGSLLLKGEETDIAIPLRGHHVPESFTRLDNLLPDKGQSNCEWGDYDHDGDLDRVCAKTAGAGETSPMEVNLYRNDGQTTFVEISPPLQGLAGPYAWGDYDRDGDLDLALTGAADMASSGGRPETRVYRNEADDVFVQLEADIQGVTQGVIAWVDFDADGDLDLHVAGKAGALLDESAPLISRLYVNNGSAEFVHSAVSFLPLRTPELFWGDFDNDGDPDLLTVGLDLQKVHRRIIYQNDGGGIFSELDASLEGLTSTRGWGDFDNDGDLDVLPAGYTESSHPRDLGHVTIHLNSGDGTFEELETNLPHASGGIHWGDYDSDGDLDAFLWGQTADHGRSVLVTRVYRNQGGGMFLDVEAPLLRTPWLKSFIGGDVSWGDYEGDSDLDLFMEEVVFQNNAIYDYPPPPAVEPPIPDPPDPPVQPGDANRDLQFDQRDIIQILQAAKYLTEQPATFEEGDWTGDGVFNQLDIIAALQTGNYLRGPYAAHAGRDNAFTLAKSSNIEPSALDNLLTQLDL